MKSVSWPFTGTVARASTPTTRARAFSLFYMMVNIGGLLGPLIAGIVRGWSWDYVFYASASWIALMGVMSLLFYKEPPHERRSEPLSTVLGRMVAVIGNVRFFSLVIGMLLLLVMGSKWWGFQQVLRAALGWAALHLIWDLALRLGLEGAPWYRQRLRVGEGRYLLFLLLMSGFWTCFNQLAMTLPEYIRDYSDTRDLVEAGHTRGRFDARHALLVDAQALP